MIRELHYLLADVFTDTPFGGNQLAVFPDAEGVPPELMQAIARELNLSETVFVLPAAAAEATHRLRIFTPSVELPFAGHPTIGCAIALNHLGLTGGSPSLVFEEGAGLVPVALEDSEAGQAVATLTSPRIPAHVDLHVDPAAIAAVISLPAEALRPPAPSAYSAGVPFTFVPVADEEALNRAKLDVGAWEATLADTAAPHLYLLSMTDWRGGREINARMFAPAMGIAEDPATGGAAAALAGLLADIQDLADGPVSWRIRQGVAMGRPSEILLSAVIEQKRLTEVRVGGSAVIMGEGRLRIDLAATSSH